MGGVKWILYQQGIFLVYDITSERSFQHIMKWASDVDEVKLWSLKHICLTVTKYNLLLINISSFKFHRPSFSF